jgi:hypothetical protein
MARIEASGIAAVVADQSWECRMIEAERYSHVTFETSGLERRIAYFTEVAGLVVAERENGLRKEVAEGVSADCGGFASLFN